MPDQTKLPEVSPALLLSRGAGRICRRPGRVGLALVIWALLGLVSCGLGRLAWAWLASQPSGSCAGLHDAPSLGPVEILLLRQLWPRPDAFALIAVLPLSASLALVLARPRWWGLALSGPCWLWYVLGSLVWLSLGC